MPWTDGKAYGRGKRPRSRQEGTLAGAALATWSALAAGVWLVSYTFGC